MTYGMTASIVQRPKQTCLSSLKAKPAWAVN
jgi:hypothetical protein